MAKRWTDREDRFLIFYGRCLADSFRSERQGYGHVASHDLGRSRPSGLRRIKELRKTKPALVAEIEAEVRKGDKEWEEG